jgi:hypothetical protein
VALAHLFQDLSGIHQSVKYLSISCAPAQISAQCVSRIHPANTAIISATQPADGRSEYARRTKATLKCAMLRELLLKDPAHFRFHQLAGRPDVPVECGYGKHAARKRRPTVEQYCAGAAVTGSTPFFRGNISGMLAEPVQQSHACIRDRSWHSV